MDESEKLPSCRPGTEPISLESFDGAPVVHRFSTVAVVSEDKRYLCLVAMESDDKVMCKSILFVREDVEQIIRRLTADIELIFREPS